MSTKSRSKHVKVPTTNSSKRPRKPTIEAPKAFSLSDFQRQAHVESVLNGTIRSERLHQGAFGTPVHSRKPRAPKVKKQPVISDGAQG